MGGWVLFVCLVGVLACSILKMNINTVIVLKFVFSAIKLLFKYFKSGAVIMELK